MERQSQPTIHVYDGGTGKVQGCRGRGTSGGGMWVYFQCHLGLRARTGATMRGSLVDNCVD